MAGKGDRPRPIEDMEFYRSEYDRIFNKQDNEEEVETQEEE